MDIAQSVTLSDGTTILLRECKESDIAQVLEIERICFEDPYSRDTFITLLESDSTFKVAEIRSRVAAYCIYKINRGLPFVRRAGSTLISLAVHTRDRERGIGSLLLKNAIQDLTRLRAHAIELQVRVDNAEAIELYSRYGFTTRKIIPSYYGPGKNAFLMQLEL